MRPELDVDREEPGDAELDALARTLPGGDPGAQGPSVRAAVLFAISRSRRRRLLAWRLSGVAAFAVAGVLAAVLLPRLGAGDGGRVVRVAEAPGVTRIRQDTGHVTYDVAPRRAGERFVVETPAAEIEVRGTRFSVGVSGDETQVAVQHGRVEVREPGHGRMRAVLTKGEHTAVRRAPVPVAGPVAVPVADLPALPAGVAPPRSPATDTVIPRVGDPFQRGRVGSPGPRSGQARTPEDAELGLFRAAHQLHFQGTDAGAALDAWNRYLAAYPRGALAEEARYNRAVCLLRLGRARDAAGDLDALASDPSAFRAREAKLLSAASLRRQGRCEEAEQLLAPLREGGDEIAQRAAALPPCP